LFQSETLVLVLESEFLSKFQV